MADEPSLTDTIAAAMKGDEAPPDPPAADPEPPVTPPQAAAEPEPVSPAAPEPPVAAAPETPPAEPPAAEPPAEPPAAVDPPTHWDVKHQEMFRKLAPDAQTFLMERSNAMEAAHTQRSQEIAPLRNAVSGWEPYLTQRNMEPAQTFQNLMQAEYTLATGTNEQKIGLLQTLAREYGVNLGGNGPAAPSAEEDPFEIHKQIQSAVAPLAQQVQQLGQGTSNRTRTPSRRRQPPGSNRSTLFAMLRGPTVSRHTRTLMP